MGQAFSLPIFLPEAARAAARSFLRTEGFCMLALCLLAPLPFLPAVIFSLILTPMSASGLVAVAHRGVTLGGPWLDPNTNFTVQALGGLSAHDWLHGVVPWWNPFTGVGVPLAGEMQTLSLFLPFVLLLHFTNGVILLKIALQMLSALATYALLRQLKVGRFAAFVGAVLYEFNGPLAWYAHAPITPIPFLPLLLLGIERAFVCAEQARRGGWMLIGVALAYSLYAGFPETAFLDGLLALVWAVYRVAVIRAGGRLSFVKKVVIGGLGGLLLAAPVVLPFLEYQGLSEIGHAAASLDAGLPKAGFAAVLMPYIFGPIVAFNDADPTRHLSNFWAGGGCYLNITVLFLAILALFTRARARGLRIILAIWILIFIARAMGVPHVGYFLSFIPFMKIISVSRYCFIPSAMATAILGAYALDDWYRGTTGQFRPVLLSGVVTLVLAFIGIGLSLNLIGHLLHNLHGKHYPVWLWGSLAFASAFTIALAVLCSRAPGRRIAVAIGTLVVMNVLALFAIPPLSGPRYEKLDLGLVAFLKQHLGLQRFYTLGPLGPNYGAYFQIASINHNAVTIPANWIRYIESRLDANAVAGNPSIFVGNFPGPFSARAEALRTNLANFEDTAVKYILVRPGRNPFIDTALLPTQGAPIRPVLLGSGEQFEGVLPQEMVRSGSLSKVGVVVGLYGGPVTGQLKAEICVAGDCVVGIRPLTEAQDRSDFEIPLDAPLRVKQGETLQYKFTYVESDKPGPSASFVFVWLYSMSRMDTAPSAVSAEDDAHYTPGIRLTYELGELRPRLVYHGDIADVLELPRPAKYFETFGAPCEVSAQTRRAVSVSCKASAVLLRRELFYPGWHASVNGRESQITRSSRIFQRIDLPAGRSRVMFSYRPTHIGLAYAAAIAGLIFLLAALPIQKFKRIKLRHHISNVPSE